MGMGRKRRRQESLWIATQELPRTKGHVFYERVNRILENLVAWIIPKDALSSCFSTPGIT